MANVLIALGGNVGDVRNTFDRAIERLTGEGDIVLLHRSSDYLTPPWGKTDQAAFTNACIEVETSLSPHALLERGQAVERALGRDRQKDEHWGPRTIDVDLLDYDGIAMNDPDLQLPHPRILERAFVLVPLAEIAPDRTIAGVPVRDALAKLDASGITQLPPRLAGLV